MDIKEFPFRLDDRTHAFLSDLVNAANNADCRLQSMVHGTAVLLFNKEGHPGTDCNIAFTDKVIKLQYTLKSISKQDGISDWLNRFHSALQKQKNATLVPISNRCFVEVHAFYDGRVHYFLTYMVAYPDESIAQDTPQGRLYFQDSLSLNRRKTSQKSAAKQSGPAPW